MGKGVHIWNRKKSYIVENVINNYQVQYEKFSYSGPGHTEEYIASIYVDENIFLEVSTRLYTDIYWGDKWADYLGDTSFLEVLLVEAINNIESIQQMENL